MQGCSLAYNLKAVRQNSTQLAWVFICHLSDVLVKEQQQRELKELKNLSQLE